MRATDRLLLLGVIVLCAGCTPRQRWIESYTSTVTPNTPYRVSGTIIDPYTYGGIADGSGGRLTKTKWGAGATSVHVGHGELYGFENLFEIEPEETFLVPDPEKDSVLEYYLASVYLDPSAEGRIYSYGPLKPAQ